MEDTQFLNEEEIESMFGSDADSIMKKSENIEQDKNETENKITDEEEKLQESGGDDNSRKGEDENPESKSGSSNFYSSIAKALKDEGIFPDLDKLDDIKDAASFKKMFENQVDSRLSTMHKRVLNALNYNVEESDIQKYEKTLYYLNNIKEQDLTAENKDGENLRKQLIFQDLINRGYSQEKAKREVEKSLNAGTDIEDAKDALASNKEFYDKSYKTLIDKAKAEEEEYVSKRKEEDNNLKKSIEDSENAFNSIPLSKEIRAKIFNNIVNPIEKDENGNYITALQKYEREHRNDFLKYVGMFYTLTDGFNDFSKMFKPVAQNAMKKGLSSLEDMLQGKTSPDNGSMTMMGGTGDNYFSGDFTIDI